MLIKILFFLLALFFIVSQVEIYAADVVINEVFANPVSESDEFVELYNTTDTAITLDNWKIADKVKEYIILSGSIPAHGFFVLEKSTTSLELNNSDEELTLKNSTSAVSDTFSYGGTTQGKSWSRSPDGTGTFYDDVNTTKNGANASPPPTSTPKPTNSPTPTKTPTPTSAPTAAKTPTPITASSTPKVVVSEPPDDSDSTLELASEVTNSPFGNSDEELTPTVKSEVLGESTSRFPVVYIVLGLILLSVCGILSYFQFGDKIFIWKKKSI